jgi:HSP20 family protein
MAKTLTNVGALRPFRAPMSPTRPEYTLFGTLQNEIDRVFDDLARSFATPSLHAPRNLVPNIEVTETDKEIEVTAELPGLERKDIEILLEDDILTIRGEKQEEEDKDKDNEKKDKNVHVSERSYGVFLRMLKLPSGIDPSSVQATMSNGVLRIVIPKPTRSEAKKIEVKDVDSKADSQQGANVDSAKKDGVKAA